MKTHPIWRAEDAELLRNLRQSAKTDALVFARLNAISLSQLRELEGVGEGGFYNNQIKSNTGIKLLKKLGHQRLPPPESDNAEEATSIATFRTQADDPTPIFQHTKPSPNSTLPAHQTRAHMGGLNPKWVAAPLILCGLVWAASRTSWDTWSQEPAPPSTPGTQAMATPIADPASASNNFTPPNAKGPSTAPDMVQTIAMPAPAQTATSDNTAQACDARHREASFSYEPAAPIKPGNYIHFVATQDANLCVIDRENRLTNLKLKAGSAQSVYGTPPFLVHSSKWSHLQVFFQGRAVPGTPDGSAHWLFKHKDL